MTTPSDRGTSGTRPHLGWPPRPLSRVSVILADELFRSILSLHSSSGVQPTGLGCRGGHDSLQLRASAGRDVRAPLLPSRKVLIGYMAELCKWNVVTSVAVQPDAPALAYVGSVIVGFAAVVSL